MASQDWLQMRSLAGEEKIRRIVDNGPVVLRIREIAGGSSTPTVVLSDTSSDITLTDSDGDAITCDLSAAAYNTVGEVADYINSAGAGSWECRVVDALRSDASNDVWPNGAVTASTSEEGETTFDVKSDTSALTKYRLRVAYDYLADPEAAKRKSHRVILKKFIYNADLTAAAGAIKVYQCTGNRATTEVQIFSALSVDTTDTTHDFGDGITAGENGELVICVDGAVVDSNAGFVQAQYKRE
jgi:hypothetical protein